MLVHRPIMRTVFMQVASTIPAVCRTGTCSGLIARYEQVSDDDSHTRTSSTKNSPPIFIEHEVVERITHLGRDANPRGRGAEDVQRGLDQAPCPLTPAGEGHGGSVEAAVGDEVLACRWGLGTHQEPAHQH